MGLAGLALCQASIAACRRSRSASKARFTGISFTARAAKPAQNFVGVQPGAGQGFLADEVMQFARDLKAVNRHSIRHGDLLSGKGANLNPRTHRVKMKRPGFFSPARSSAMRPAQRMGVGGTVRVKGQT